MHTVACFRNLKQAYQNHFLSDQYFRISHGANDVTAASLVKYILQLHSSHRVHRFNQRDLF